ncbi:MAG: hypothetical protein WC670_08415 [Pseudolabrys sp.]|jgi:hypothetical protein
MGRELSLQPVGRLLREIHRVLAIKDEQLARLEILTVAVAAFSRPIPDYEPCFQHQRRLTARATELRTGCL